MAPNLPDLRMYGRQRWLRRPRWRWRGRWTRLPAANDLACAQLFQLVELYLADYTYSLDDLSNSYVFIK